MSLKYEWKFNNTYGTKVLTAISIKKKNNNNLSIKKNPILKSNTPKTFINPLFEPDTGNACDGNKPNKYGCDDPSGTVTDCWSRDDSTGLIKLNGSVRLCSKRGFTNITEISMVVDLSQITDPWYGKGIFKNSAIYLLSRKEDINPVFKNTPELINSSGSRQPIGDKYSDQGYVCTQTPTMEIDMLETAGRVIAQTTFHSTLTSFLLGDEDPLTRAYCTCVEPKDSSVVDNWNILRQTLYLDKRCDASPNIQCGPKGVNNKNPPLFSNTYQDELDWTSDNKGKNISSSIVASQWNTAWKTNNITDSDVSNADNNDFTFSTVRPKLPIMGDKLKNAFIYLNGQSGQQAYTWWCPKETGDDINDNDTPPDYFTKKVKSWFERSRTKILSSITFKEKFILTMKFGDVNDKTNEWNSSNNRAMVQTIQQCDQTGNPLSNSKPVTIFDSTTPPGDTGDAQWGHSSCIGNPLSINKQGLRINNNINNSNLTSQENSILTSRLYSPVRVNTPYGELNIRSNTSIGGDQNQDKFGWEMLRKYLQYGFYIIFSWSDGNLYNPTQYDGVIGNFNPNDGFVNMANSYDWPGIDPTGKDININYNSPNSENPYLSFNDLDQNPNDVLNNIASKTVDKNGPCMNSDSNCQPTPISEMIRGYPTQQWTSIVQTNVWPKIKKSAPDDAEWVVQGKERLPTFVEAKKINGIDGINVGFGYWTIQNINIKAIACINRTD